MAWEHRVLLYLAGVTMQHHLRERTIAAKAEKCHYNMLSLPTKLVTCLDTKYFELLKLKQRDICMIRQVTLLVSDDLIYS